MNDFLSWTNHTLSDNHPFTQYSNEDYFAYADYMHLPELFGDDQHPLINVRIFDYQKEK
jgi:hypothetical protein